MLRTWNFGHKKQKERGSGGGTRNKKKHYVLGVVDTKNIKEGARCNMLQKKKVARLEI